MLKLSSLWRPGLRHGLGVVVAVTLLFFSARTAAAQCPYTSIQSRVKLPPLAEPWVTQLTINQGDSFYVGGFYNGTGNLDGSGAITLALIAPSGTTYPANNSLITASAAGTYQLRATCGALVDTAYVTVNGSACWTGSPLTASSCDAWDTSYGPCNAIDGSTSTKWASKLGDGTHQHWISVNLGATRDVRRVIVKHASVNGKEPSSTNTRMFRLDYWNGADWTPYTTIDNSRAWHAVTATPVLFQTDKLLLTVVQSGEDSVARIYEIETKDSSACNPAPASNSLAWPVSGSWFSPAGWTLMTGSDLHAGDDYYAQDWGLTDPANPKKYLCDRNIYSPVAGTVLFAKDSGSGYGIEVIIQSAEDQNYAVRVAHLSKPEPGIAPGVTVTPDSVIGQVGRSGLASTADCHAHIALYKNIYQSSCTTCYQGIYVLQTTGGPPSGSIKRNTGPSLFAQPFSLGATTCSHP